MSVYTKPVALRFEVKAKTSSLEWNATEPRIPLESQKQLGLQQYNLSWKHKTSEQFIIMSIVYAKQKYAQFYILQTKQNKTQLNLQHNEL